MAKVQNKGGNMTKFIMLEKGWVYATEDRKIYIERVNRKCWAVLFRKTNGRCYFHTLNEAKAFVRTYIENKNNS